ncbi:uncharacterized protein PG986_000045 [Apiospora aurea]|uniref:Heterokaryon incompatibility domain-containing protein n=1 Tax=Apiospora aurea TaxID=335848 RepID=A0ABR1QSZ9_9PEZI
MDHLPRPVGASSPLKFEYHGSASWSEKTTDYEQWRSYPRIHGWKLDPFRYASEALPIVLGGRAFEQLAELLQSWMFFGPLAIVIEQSDPLVFVRSAVDGVRVIDTSALLVRAKEWVDATIAEWRQNKQPWGFESERRLKTLDFALDFVRHLRQHDSEQPSHETAALSNICLAVDLLIIVLHEAVEQVWNSLNPRTATAPFDCFESRFSGWSRSVADCLSENGWCPTDPSRLSAAGGIEAVCVASLVCRRGPGLPTHERCEEDECIAYNVPKGTYVPKHATACRYRESCGVISVPSGSPDDILVQTDSYPILQASVHSEFGGPNSHQQELRAIKYEPGMKYIAISHVWSDGLVVYFSRLQKATMSPWVVSNALGLRSRSGRPTSGSIRSVFPHKKEARRLACARMASSYENASLVLVLDSELQSWQYHKGTDAEALLRIVSSSWAKRVWTLSEGILARRLVFQFADCLFEIEEVRNRILARLQTDPLAVFTTLERKLFVHMVNMRNIRGLEPVERFADGFTLTKPRGTSHPGDDIISLAVLVGLPHIETLYDIHGWDERWMEFLRRMEAISVGVLFYRGPRMEQPGFRWAPRTLGYLGREGFGTSEVKAHVDSRLGGLILNSVGLLLTGNWWKISNFNRQKTFSDALYEPVEAGKPWYEISWADNWHKYPVSMAKSAAVEAAFGTNLALLFAAPNLKLVGPSSPAILLSQVVVDKIEGIISGTYLARVYVEPMEERRDQGELCLLGDVNHWMWLVK